MRLFTYAVLFHPTDEEKKQGQKTEVLVKPGEYELFPNEQAVQALALRHKNVTDEHIKNADRLEVAVRPF